MIEPPSEMFCADRVTKRVGVGVGDEAQARGSEPSRMLAPSKAAFWTTCWIWLDAAPGSRR